MKTKEELGVIRHEVESVSKKLRELTPEELAQVTGGLSQLDETDVLMVGLFLPAKPSDETQP